MGQTLAIRCISLAGSDRRPRMAAQLDAAGLDWAFFDACTAPPHDLPYLPDRALAVHGRELTPGELGCFASHWALWKLVAAEDGPDLLLVLEDDLLLDPVFFSRLDAVAAAARRFGYLRLYAKVPAGMRLETSFLDRHVARFSGRAYGTQAYLIDRASAQRWLSSIPAIVRPVDDEMDRYWQHGIPIRSVFPAPVIEVNYGSTIEAKRRASAPLGRAQRMRWQGVKLGEKARRHLADLAARIIG